MSTGYTYKINDGTMSSAKEFLLEYVKRFGLGYFVTRQSSRPMPKKYSKNLAKDAIGDYHTKQLEIANKALESFNRLTEKELLAKYNNYVALVQKENQRRMEDKSVIEQRYLDMIKKVEKWVAPSELEEMKKSAISHLTESKEFDCKLYLENISTYDEWLKEERESLVQDVNYHTKEKAKEDKRIAEMDTVLREFYQSLENLE